MQTTVLFADLSGTSKLSEAAGEAVALEAITHCIERLRKAAESAGGQVVKTVGEQIMALFPNPDAAAAAAARMHAAIEALPAMNGTKLAVHVGFHTGPVIQRERDVVGDTVKLASRLLEEAQKGQTVTSQETADLLGPGFRAVSRDQAITFRGGEAKVQPCEVLARGPLPQVSKAMAGELRLTYREQVIACSPGNDSVVIGRHQGCAIVVTDPMASRRHCTIELRGGDYVVQDHSTNGTYVTVDGERGILLKGEDLPLRKSGTLAFGHKRFADSETIEFFCVVGP